MSSTKSKKVQRKTAAGGRTKAALAKKYAVYRKTILSIKSKPCLYDEEDPRYSDEKVVHQAWLEVIDECPMKDDDGSDMSVEGIQKKWATFKKAFCKERGQRMKNGKSKGGWPLYDAMTFMDEHISLRIRKNPNIVSAQHIKNKIISTPSEEETAGDAAQPIDETLEDDKEAGSNSYSTTLASDEKSSLREKLNVFKITDDPSDKNNDSADDESPSNGYHVNELSSSATKSKRKQSDLTVVDIHADDAGQQIKRIKMKHDKKMRNDRLDEARLKAREELQREAEVENQVSNCQKNNLSQPAADEGEKKINKAFSDFVVASLDKIEDEKIRRALLKDVMNILYTE